MPQPSSDPPPLWPTQSPTRTAAIDTPYRLSTDAGSGAGWAALGTLATRRAAAVTEETARWCGSCRVDWPTEKAIIVRTD